MGAMREGLGASGKQPGVSAPAGSGWGALGPGGRCLSTSPCVGRGDQAGLPAGRVCRLSGSPVFCVWLHVEPSRLRGCRWASPCARLWSSLLSRDGVTDVGSILRCWVRGSRAHAPAAGC